MPNNKTGTKGRQREDYTNKFNSNRFVREMLRWPHFWFSFVVSEKSQWFPTIMKRWTLASSIRMRRGGRINIPAMTTTTKVKDMGQGSAVPLSSSSCHQTATVTWLASQLVLDLISIQFRYTHTILLDPFIMFEERRAFRFVGCTSPTPIQSNTLMFSQIMS